VYVLSNVGALFLNGRPSDQIGRAGRACRRSGSRPRRVVFLFASGTAWLFVGQVLTGLATGLGAGTATAWVAELQPPGNKQSAAAIAPRMTSPLDPPPSRALDGGGSSEMRRADFRIVVDRV
jgi:MFS family permease